MALLCTNLLPFTVIVKEPVGMSVGVTALTNGIGFCNVMVALADAVLSAALVAVIVTELGFGIAAGDLYLPVESMVPTVEFPPATPLTVQLTAVFVLFATVAVRLSVSPMRTFAVPGATVTLVAGGFGGGLLPPVT